MIIDAIGVFVVPAKTLTKPSAAKRGILLPIKSPKATPLVAPTKNIGVIIPPLPPEPSDKDVKRDLSIKSHQFTSKIANFVGFKISLIVSNPNPKYLSDIKYDTKTINEPAVKAILYLLYGSFLIIFSVLLTRRIKNKATKPKNIPAAIT